LKKKSLFLLFLIFLCAPFFSEEKYEEVFYKAQKLQAAQCYKEAATEYKRYIFLSDYATVENLGQAYVELSRYYKSTASYDLALDYTHRAINIIYEDFYKHVVMSDYDSYLKTEKEFVLLQELYIQDINLLTLKAEKEDGWLEREQRILSYISFEQYSDKVRQFAYFALIKSDLDNWEWDRAKDNFETLVNLYPGLYSKEQIDLFNKLIEEQKKAKQKNPKLAVYLSIISGLGQTYAGNPKDGLNAFLLNGSLITACVFSIITQNYADVILFEAEMIVRFYRGNLYNAQMEAVKYNENQNNEYARKLTKIVEPEE
jgi:TM2 domain-containing membrane protein YozV